MADLEQIKRSLPAGITGEDEAYIADVFPTGGKKRLAVDANISSINVPLGKDPLPDMYFTIITAPSSVGDTIRVQIAGTNKDTTSPDRDLPPVDITYTAVSADIGDEVVFCDNFTDYLNSQVQMQNALLEANFVNDDGRAIIHITSIVFSMNGEFYERPFAGDVVITTTGGITYYSDNENDRLVSRPKEVSLARDPSNPHRLGIQNVSGTVRLRAQEVDQILKEYLKDSFGVDEMSVNGQATPVSFRISSNPNSGFDKVVERLEWIISDTNIKVGSGYFLGNNSALTNGILVRFYKDGILKYSEPLIKTTKDILGQWSTTASDNKIINQSGGDYLEANYNLVAENLQFILRAGKNDYIEVLIQDNLSSRDSIRMLAGGFLE